MSAVVAPPTVPPARGKRAALLAAVGLGTAEGFGGLGVSLAVHGVILLGAALYAVDAHRGVPGLTLASTPGDDSEELRLDVIDTAVELAGSQSPTFAGPPDRVWNRSMPTCWPAPSPRPPPTSPPARPRGPARATGKGAMPATPASPSPAAATS